MSTAIDKIMIIPCLKDDRALTIGRDKYNIKFILGDLIDYSMADPRNLRHLREMINDALKITGMQ